MIAIAIGAIALLGYVLGNAPIASVGGGKPVSAVTALAFIVLGAGLLALHRAPAGVSTARRAALAVVLLAGADLLTAAFSAHIEAWQVWGTRGGVYLHAFPVTAILMLALGVALVFATTRRDLDAHLIASAVLLICAVFLFAYVLKVQLLLDPYSRVAPVFATTVGLALISAAELIARPRGWVVPLLSRTSTGVMSRVLLLATFIVPYLASALRSLIAGMRWYDSDMSLAVVVDVVEVFVSAAVVLGTGVFLYKRESDRMRLASIVELSDDAIIATSKDGVIEQWNAGAEKVYGYTAAEALGRPVTMLAPPELQGEAPLLLERIRRGERIDPFETIRVTRGGRRVDVLLSVSPVLNDEGSPIGASSIAHDVTDRKKAEEEVRLLAEQHAAMLATSTDGFWLADLEGRLLEVNDAYCRMSGYSREDLLEMTIGDIDAIETAGVTASRIRNIVDSGFARFETKHRTRDNRILDIEISASLWRAAGRMLVFARDITQRNEEQKALRSSQERLQLAQSVAGIGLFDWDIRNNLTTRSDEMAVLYGLPPGGLGARHEDWRERIFPADLPAVDAAIETSLTSGQLSQYFRVVWPDASIHWLRARGKVFFSDDGKPIRMLGVNIDITERMQIEEALEKSENALKEGQRVAHVGHWEWSALTGATTWSDEVYRILGIPIGSATPSYELLFGIIDQDGRRKMEEEIARALGSSRDLDGFVDMDLPITTPAGKRVVLSQRAFVDRDGVGNVVGFHGTCQDITKRVEIEEALRHSKAALAEAQQIAKIGSAIVYPITDEIQASEEYFRIFDLEPRAGTPIVAFLNRVHPEDRGAVKAALKAAVLSGSFDVEFRIVRGDGSVRFAHGMARTRVTSDRFSGLLGTVEDVTERQRAEETLRHRNEKLKQANLELERFNRLAVGRELRMIDLKREVNDLRAQLGQPEPYVLPENRISSIEGREDEP
ncbi:MAG TPA: PAS domain S-box protein [Thermoanaerobaculia bacterium]|nr:PAS domain S-box protein [Thermoanaerobaculia bacterium]